MDTITEYAEQIINLSYYGYIRFFFPFFIALLGFGLMLVVMITVKPQEKAVAQIIKLNGRLTLKKSGAFNYEKTKEKLMKNGLGYRFPALLEPVTYISVKVMVAILMGILASVFMWQLVPVFIVLGFFMLDILGMITDRSDNSKMMPDIQLIYNSLTVQIRSNVYQYAALSECREMVTNIRLKEALYRFSIEYQNPVIGSKKALQNLSDRFNNPYIESLCLTLLQAEESGKSVDLLNDLSEQIKDFARMELERKKADMDRSMTVAILILFADIMGLIIWLCASQIMTELSGF